MIKADLETNPALQDVWVQGEVSNCRQYASGHWYWTLKEDDASLSCVMWKGIAAKQDVTPEDGSAFNVHGSISFYARGGQLQLYVDRLEVEGIGDLHRRFAQLKAKLEAEGLFDPRLKRPLPRFPRRIGVVTSPDAAALRDLCHVLERRWPSAEVFLAPTRVQGESAPAEIVAALDAIERAGVDVVIVTRGGGSIEDLWAFNDEAVARAIRACPVPVVAGVGHETDFTIADFVADVRAPTPSAAAEIVAPDARELRLGIDELRLRAGRSLDRRLAVAGERLKGASRRLALASPARTAERRVAALVDLRRRLRSTVVSRLRFANASLEACTMRLEALSPRSVLARGFAHVSRTADGSTVRSAEDVASGDGIRVQVHSGEFGAVVAGQGRLFD